MIVSIYSLVPDAKALLELEPEELASVLMEHLNSLPPSEQRQQLNRYNFGLPHTVQEYPKDQREELSQALMDRRSLISLRAQSGLTRTPTAIVALPSSQPRPPK